MQEITEQFNNRHSLHIVANKLRYQREDNAKSVCLKLPSNHVLETTTKTWMANLECGNKT